MGFDLNILLKESRIAKLSPNSAAYLAGVREGQEISGRSIYYDSPAVEHVVEENGQRKKISCLPVTNEKVLTPQFELKQNLSAAEDTNCLRNL